MILRRNPTRKRLGENAERLAYSDMVVLREHHNPYTPDSAPWWQYEAAFDRAARQLGIDPSTLPHVECTHTLQRTRRNKSYPVTRRP